MGYGNGGTTAGYIGGDGPRAALQREATIPSQMAAMEKHTEHLHQTIAELQARIASVLTPEPASNATKDPGVPHPGVPLGASLSEMNNRIVHATGRLRELIDRIEL